MISDRGLYQLNQILSYTDIRILKLIHSFILSCKWNNYSNSYQNIVSPYSFTPSISQCPPQLQMKRAPVSGKNFFRNLRGRPFLRFRKNRKERQKNAPNVQIRRGPETYRGRGGPNKNNFGLQSGPDGSLTKHSPLHNISNQTLGGP